MPTPKNPARCRVGHTTRHRSLAIAALALAGLALPLAGCGATSNSAAPAQRTAMSPAEARSSLPINDEDYARLGYRRDWRAPTYISSRGRLAAIHVEPDLIVTRESGSTVTTMRPDSGRQIWSNELAGPLTRFVGFERFTDERVERQNGERVRVRRERVVVCSESEAFVLDNNTGSLVGRDRYEQVVNTAPVRFGELLIFGNPRGELFAHVLGRGVKLWGYRLSGAIEANLVQMGGVVGAVSQAGDVLFVDASTGRSVGRASIFGGLETNPVTDGRYMFIAGMDQSVWAFRPDGSLVWRHRTPHPLRVQPEVHDGVLYCELEERGLVAFDTGTGEVLWENEDITGTVLGVRDGRLLVWNGREAFTVGVQSGSIHERAQLPGVRFLKVDEFVDGNLYAASADGQVARFVPFP